MLVPKKFWEVKNNVENSSVGELMIYGNLSDRTWYGDEVTPLQFYNDLESLGDINELKVRINCYGGDVFAGQAIYTQLIRLKNEKKCIIKTYNDGITASAAGLIFNAGDKRIMPRNTNFMMHLPMLGLCGYYNELELQQYLEALGPIKSSVIAIFEDNSKLENAVIDEMLKKTTWLTAEEAIELGLADVISDEIELDVQMKSDDLMMINDVEVDCTMFSSMPVQFMNMAKMPINKIEVPSAPLQVQEEEIMNAKELQEKHPEIYNEVFNSGVLVERSRVQNIQELAVPGQDEFLNDALFVKPLNAGEFAIAQTKAQNDLKQTKLINMQKDAEIVEEVDPPAGKEIVEEEKFKNDVNDLVSFMGE